jgi:hypothetical protein
MTGIFFLVGIGVYAYLTSFLFLRIFRKYRPEIDTDQMLQDQLSETPKESSDG